jgi:hypothetical protein
LPFTVKLVDMVSSLDAAARDAGDRLFLWSSRWHQPVTQRPLFFRCNLVNPL